MDKIDPDLESPFNLGDQGCLPFGRPDSGLGHQAHGKVRACALDVAERTNIQALDERR
ncbi:MAG TPA: hypothetical protein VIM99_11700 [Blastocatellia bacterium]